MAKSKKESGFFYDNTVEVTAPDGTKIRVFKGEVDKVKSGFAKLKKQAEAAAKPEKK